MPLVLISGYPCSGKTYRARQLVQDFESRIAPTNSSNTAQMTVTLISDHTLSIPRSAYATATAEKTARATLSAAIIRALSPSHIVVVDAPSYIKGWRYQLYCEAKAQRTGSCVVQIGTPVAQCRTVNESRLSSMPNAKDTAMEGAPYDPPVFDNLVERYEEPNGMTRWDSPLFLIAYSDEKPPCEAIWNALMKSDGTAKIARPNASTILPAARPANALSALERASQAVVETIAAWSKDHPGEGGQLNVEGVQESISLPPDGVPFAQLQRLRRQFIGLSRTQVGDFTPERMSAVFVRFLNDTWGTSD